MGETKLVGKGPDGEAIWEYFPQEATPLLQTEHDGLSIALPEGINTESKNGIYGALDQLSGLDRALLKKLGLVIRVPEALVDVADPGDDNVVGLFETSSSLGVPTIEIPLTSKPFGESGLSLRLRYSPEESFSTTLHELGHALDYAYGQALGYAHFSDGPVFTGLDNLLDQNTLPAYYKGPGGKGQLFADLYAVQHGGKPSGASHLNGAGLQNLVGPNLWNQMKNIFGGSGTLAQSNAVDGLSSSSGSPSILQSIYSKVLAGLSAQPVGCFTTIYVGPDHNIPWQIGGAEPLVLNLDGASTPTTSLSGGTYFDFDGSGFAQQTSWVSPNDGLLVIDPNDDGLIKDGAQLFGTWTKLSNGMLAANGYDALAALDSNHDGAIILFG